MPLQRGWQLMLILCIAVEVVEQAGLTNAATASEFKIFTKIISQTSYSTDSVGSSL